MQEGEQSEPIAIVSAVVKIGTCIHSSVRSSKAIFSATHR